MARAAPGYGPSLGRKDLNVLSREEIMEAAGDSRREEFSRRHPTGCRHFSPNHLLFREAMKGAAGEGYSIFDFGRTAPGNSSLMTFKGRRGTGVSEMPHYYYPPLISSRITQREMPPACRLIKRTCRNAPGPVLMRLGEFIYGHPGYRHGAERIENGP